MIAPRGTLDAMTEEPSNPGKLAGGKWSNVDPAVQYRHYVVTEVHATGEVVLASVLVPASTLRLPWRELRDRAVWRPGWI